MVELDRRRLISVAVAALALAPVSGAIAQRRRSGPHIPHRRNVVVYSGAVNERTAERFLEMISRNVDAVIGLAITVEPSNFEANERYLVSLDDGRLVISAGDPLNAPEEVVINGPTGTTLDMTTVDGFYLIKSGGMHAAGAISWGAMPVDEASLRLNPNVTVIRRPF